MLGDTQVKEDLIARSLILDIVVAYQEHSIVGREIIKKAKRSSCRPTGPMP